MTHLLNLETWSIGRSLVFGFTMIKDASKSQQIGLRVSLTDCDFVASVDSTVELLALCIFGIQLHTIDKDAIAAVCGDKTVQAEQFRPVSAHPHYFVDAFGVKVDHDTAFGHAGVQWIWEDNCVQGASSPSRDTRTQIERDGTERVRSGRQTSQSRCRTDKLGLCLRDRV